MIKVLLDKSEREKRNSREQGKINNTKVKKNKTPAKKQQQQQKNVL